MRGAVTPRLRTGLAALGGYHSPQVDVRVRLNNNESPYPPPATFVDELAAAVRKIPLNRYPERTNRSLRRAVAEVAGVGEGQVFAANGSNEVLQTLLLAYGGGERRALAFSPTYTLHAQISRVTGTPLTAFPRTPDLCAGPEVVESALAQVDPDIVFFCHPNNPTGIAEDPAAVRIAATGGTRLVVVDEAYVEFASTSMLGLVDDHPNVVVVRTLSKAWAVPSCRIGYLIGAEELVRSLEAAELPYHLGALSQEAGRLALMYEADMRRRVEEVVGERDRIVTTVAEMDGVDVWPSEANFVLIRPQVEPGAVWRGLLDRGVLVRDFSSREDLPGCLRVTVGTRDENDVFLAALGPVLDEIRDDPPVGER